MVVTRRQKDLGNYGARGNFTEGVVPGRCQAVQQGLLGRQYVTDCRIEVVPLDTEAVRRAVERLEDPQILQLEDWS